MHAINRQRADTCSSLPSFSSSYALTEAKHIFNDQLHVHTLGDPLHLPTPICDAEQTRGTSGKQRKRSLCPEQLFCEDLAKTDFTTHGDKWVRTSREWTTYKRQCNQLTEEERAVYVAHAAAYQASLRVRVEAVPLADDVHTPPSDVASRSEPTPLLCQVCERVSDDADKFPLSVNGVAAATFSQEDGAKTFNEQVNRVPTARGHDEAFPSHANHRVCCNGGYCEADDEVNVLIKHRINTLCEQIGQQLQVKAGDVAFQDAFYVFDIEGVSGNAAVFCGLQARFAVIVLRQHINYL